MKKTELEETAFFKSGWEKVLMIMKLTFFLIFLGLTGVSASVYSQSKKLTLNVENETIREVFDLIESQSEFVFIYKKNVIDPARKVNLKVEELTIEKVLDKLFTNSDIKYEILNRQIILTPNRSVKSKPVDIHSALQLEQPQQKEITGKVTDTGNLPLPGVSVIVKGTTIGTVTNTDGEFSLNIPLNAETLQFSFVGMKTQEMAVEGRTTIAVEMEEESFGIDEVVVTALGIQKQVKALGYSAQEVGEEDLSAARDVSLAGFLTAKVAGVQISRGAGGATGSTNVTIRGNSSLVGNNQPLYVVDGVPIINNPKSSGGIFGHETDYGDGISDINPEDVLSMTVLKGPNASSLYGSRGANGVILITTKSGSKRKGIGVEVNSNVSIETINLIPRTQNKYASGWDDVDIGSEFETINGVTHETYPVWNNFAWGPPLDGTRVVWDPFLLPGESPRPLTLVAQPEDNIKEFYDIGVTNQNTIALSGGNKKTTGRVSFGNTSYSGITPNHKVKKQSISARVTSEMTDFLSFDAKMSYFHDEGSQRPTLGSSTANASFVLAQMGRMVPLDFLKKYYEETGEPGQFPGLWGDNPYAIVNKNRNDDYRDRFMAYLSTTIKFADWLSLMGRAGIDTYTEYREKVWPIGSYINWHRNGEIHTDLMHLKDINADAILTANKKLSDKFSVSGSLGASLLKQHRDGFALQGTNFNSKGVYHISNANTLTGYNQTFYDKEMQSGFFAGQVAYNGYLYLDITGRNDWSSALGLNSQSYFYPSVSTSFIFSDAFGVNDKILSFGKIRLSWAQVGNDSDPYLTKIGYISETQSYNGQGFVATPGTVPLIDLKNELTESFEIGADLRLFQNRLSIDATYYNAKTTNQIIPANISPSSGYQQVIINAGQIDNKGFEAVLSANPIRTSGGFSWDFSFNYSKNKNTVVALTDEIDSYPIGPEYIGGSASNSINATVGQPYGEIIGINTQTVADGEYKGQYIVAENGQYATETETSVMGNIQPDWIGGLNNQFSYKGLSISFLMDFVQGGDLFSYTKHEMTSRGTGKWTEVGREGGILPGVLEVKNDNGDVTGYRPNDIAISGQDYWLRRARGQSNWFILDASYIMLREVLLSYRVKPSLLKKTPLEGATVSVVGRNLFYLEEHMEDMGISPESAPNTSAALQGYEAFSMPTTRTFGVNVKLSF